MTQQTTVSISPPNQPNDIIRSVQRALRILELLAQHPAGLSAKHINQRLRLNLSTCYHQLNTLMASGYVIKNPETLRFQLSGKIGYAVHGHTSPAQLVQQLMPYVETLQETTCETAYLALWDGEEIFLAGIIETSQTVRVKTLTIGATYGNHAVAWGKAILACLDETQLDRYLAERQLPAYTKNTLTTVEALKANLAEVRQRGYSLDLEESLDDVYCIGAPIFEAQGRVVASVTISVPGSRYYPRQERLLPRVIKTAKAASRALSILGYGSCFDVATKTAV